MTKAKEYAQNHIGDIEIRVDSGEYYIEEPIVITNEDFSENELIITGSAEGTTSILGGVEVSDWREEGNLYVAQISEDISDIREFYVNGTAATRARTADAVAITGDLADYAGFSVETDGLTTTEIEAITTASNAEAVMDISWVRQRVAVKSAQLGADAIDVTAEDAYKEQLSDAHLNKLIAPLYSCSQTSYLGNDCNGMNYWEEEKAVWFENALGLLDEPGEFYYDNLNNLLYYYPRSGETLTDCIIPISEGFIKIQGTADHKVSDVTVKDLSFSYGTWLKPSDDGVLFNQAGYIGGAERLFAQIQASWADNVTVKNVTMNNISTTAVDFYEGVTNSRIMDCTFENVGASAVSVGPFDSTTAVSTICENITIQNNDIDTVGYVYGGQPAIAMYYVNDTKALNNDINYTTYTGISLGWGWGGTGNVEKCANNEVGYNKIANVMTQFDDGGFIYTLGDLHQSTIHDNYMNQQHNWGGAIYFDSGSDNITVSNNVVFDCNAYRPDGEETGWFLTTVTEQVNIIVDTLYTDDTNSYSSEYMTISNIYQADYYNDAATEILNNAGIKG